MSEISKKKYLKFSCKILLQIINFKIDVIKKAHISLAIIVLSIKNFTLHITITIFFI